MNQKILLPLLLAALLSGCASAPSQKAETKPVADAVALTPEDRVTFFVNNARSGELIEVAKELQAKIDVNAFDTLEQTALIGAVSHQQILVVKLLLNSGANPNLADPAGWTPLIHAVYSGASPELLAVLIDGGADVNRANDRNITPLYLASVGGREEQVKYLLERGADPALASKAGYTPLRIAQLKGLGSIVTLLKTAPAATPTATP